MNNMKTKILSMLVLLMMTATGAWADSWTGETYTATANEAIKADITVSDDATLTINEGVTMTINGTITVAEGKTLTIYGPGTLRVNGTTGKSGTDNKEGDGGNGSDGSTAIAGTVVIYNGTVQAYGGDGGRGGNAGDDEFPSANSANGGNGANGSYAFSGSVTIYGGNVTAQGGSGGDYGTYYCFNGKNGVGGYGCHAFGGSVTIYGGNVTAQGGGNRYDEATKTAFASAPTINAKEYTMTNGSATITSTDRQGKVVIQSADYDPNAIEVNINEAQTEATFEMPTYNTLVSYELVRDMSIQMTVTVQDANGKSRFRVQEEGDGYAPVGMTMIDVAALFNVHDDIENADLIMQDDYYGLIYPVNEQGEPQGDGITLNSFEFAPGQYVVKALAQEDSGYEGETGLSNIFTLFQGYKVEVEAGGFATYFKDEPLTIDESTPGAELYTVSEVSDKAAVLSSKITVAPEYTPLLVYNPTEEKKTFLLVPTDETADEGVEPADEFRGTLGAKNMGASSDNMNYYVCDGTQFVWVRSAGTIAANRCWLQIGTAEPVCARAIVFGETTGIEELTTSDSPAAIYDISGRKVSKARKGVFIQNGKKVVVK